MRFDSKCVKFTKKLQKLFEEKRGQVFGLNIPEYIRIFSKLFLLGDQENEPFNERKQRVIEDDKSKKKVHIWYEWFPLSGQECSLNRILKIRNLKFIR